MTIMKIELANQQGQQGRKSLQPAISTNTNPRTHLSVAVYGFAEKGYSRIELQCEHKAKEDYCNPRIIYELAAMQRDYKLKFSGHASYISTDLASADEIKRRQSVETVMKQIDFFAAFGVETVTVHTGRGNFSHNFDQLCFSVEQLVSYAAQFNMKV